MRLMVSAGTAPHALLCACACPDMTWLEGEANAEMYERAGFLATEDGGINVLAGSTLGGGEPAAPSGLCSCYCLGASCIVQLVQLLTLARLPGVWLAVAA
jgi:hypothetical protein